MILARWIFERVIKFHDDRLVLMQEQWGKERDGFVARIQWLQEGIAHERLRAEQAIDRLLAKEAQVAPLQTTISELLTPTGKKEFDEKEVSAMSEMEKIFKDVGRVGEDDAEGPMKSVVTVNGVPVGFSDREVAEVR